MELALIALPVAALPHIAHQPPWITLLVVLAIAARAWLLSSGRQAPSIGIMALLAVLAGSLTLVQYGTVFGQEAGTALLLIMIAFKLLEARNRRDIVIALFLGYFVVVTTYFFDQSILTAAYSLLATWLLTAALIQVHAERHIERRRLARQAGAMLLHALPFMLVLFLAFPRIQGPLWGDPQREETARTGLSDELNPGDIAELLQDESTALRVEFDAAAPPLRAQYWRALVMTDFDGRRWSTDRNTEVIQPPVTDDTLVHYTATLEPTRVRYLPVLDYPAVLPDGAELHANYQVLRDRRITRRIQYQAAADLTTPPGADDPQLPPAERARALDLPAAAAPRARTKVALWRATHGDDDRALIDAALQRFAAEPYRYTLQPPRLAGDATDQFLFETQAGYCEHYASAFAVLMRAAGIPTRVVTGYQGGSWQTRGEYLRLRNADAHAWNEVWLDGQGWVRVDPTAAIAPERIEQGLPGLARDTDEPIPAFLRRGEGLSWLQSTHLSLEDWRDFARFRWESWVLAFDPERQRELFARLGLDPRDWRSVLIALGTGFGTIGLIALAWVWIRTPRHRRPAADRVLGQLSRRLARHDPTLARAPYEPVDAWSRRVAHAHPELGTTLETFARTYNRQRFGRLTPEQRTADLHQLRGLLRTVPRARPAFAPRRNDASRQRAAN
ncbi:transglutaminaseTgpA domain-containing protein [Thioalkalivibrio sp. ALJT]|uniref:transglutaminase family protein n=1 Tax=Thioalkalivibrio sp. ALJT TaxID=1158146 RepID=UPI0004759F25